MSNELTAEEFRKAMIYGLIIAIPVGIIVFYITFTLVINWADEQMALTDRFADNAHAQGFTEQDRINKDCYVKKGHGDFFPSFIRNNGCDDYAKSNPEFKKFLESWQ